jgi:hypothetical protein
VRSTALQTYDPEAFAEPVLTEADMSRKCAKCGKLKPTTAYQYPKAVNCKTCVRRRCLIGQRDRLRTSLANLAQHRIVAAARGDRLDAPRISQVCAEMFSLLGGVDGFCKRWFTNLEILEKERPASKTLMDEYRALTKLLRESTASIDATGGGVASLSDEDLDREIDVAVARIVDTSIPEIEGPIDGVDEDEEFDEEEVDDDDLG